jgi:hypothetical protein
MLLLIGETMKAYNEYGSVDFGVKDVPLLLKGLDENRISNLIAFAYSHGADDVKLKTVPGSNGWNYEMEILAKNYDADIIGQLAKDNGYASYAFKFDMESKRIEPEEKIERKIKQYVV